MLAPRRLPIATARWYAVPTGRSAGRSPGRTATMDDRWSHRHSRAARRGSASKGIALLVFVVVAVIAIWIANNSSSADAGTANRYEDMAAQWKARGDAYQAAREQKWSERDDHAHRILHDVNWHLERLRKGEASREEPEIRGALADLNSDLREWNSLVVQDRSTSRAAR